MYYMDRWANVYILNKYIQNGVEEYMYICEKVSI